MADVVHPARTGRGALAWARRRWWPLAVVALAVGSVALWLPSLSLPLHVDAAGYATAAYWWARGDTLYRELTITRPQGIFVIFRTIEALDLGSIAGIHLAASLYAMLCALTLLAVASKVWGRGIGLGAAALFALLLATPALEGYSANAELFMLLPLLGSLALLSRAGDQPTGSRAWLGWLAGTGFLGAVATLIKPAGVVALPLGALWLARCPIGWRRWGVGTGALALGAAAGLLPALIHGLVTAPDQYLDAVLFYRLGEDSALSPRNLSFQLYLFVYQTSVLLWRLPVLLVAGVGLWSARYLDPPRRDLLWLWTLTALVGAALGGNWWPHYYQQVLPPLAVATALGYRALWRRSRCPRVVLAQGLALAGAGLLTLTIWGILTAPGDPVRLTPPGFSPLQPAAAPVGAYLRARTTPDETVFVAYHQPDIYYLAERRPAARWLYWRELKWTPGAFDEQVARLANPATAPRYIVAAQPFDWLGFDPGGELRAVVARDYTLETTIEGIPLYRRNE